MPITREYPQYNDPVIIIWRKNTIDDPYVSITESRIVINNISPLKEIPDEFNHVQVSGYTEIYNGVPTSTQFIVNYQTGQVTFNPSENGKTLTFTYKGKGMILYPAERIYSHTDNPDVITSLQDIIDSGNEAIQALDLLGETINDANAATDSANTAATNANTKATYAQTQGDYAKTQGDYAKSSGDAFSYKGIYSSATAYIPKNIVFYNGVAYINIVSSTNVIPTNTTNWKRLGYMSWQGTYSTATTYITGDFVTDASNYNMYISIKDANTNQPLTNTTYWTKIISVQTVVDNAVTATTNANTATTQANTARDSANTAATAANTAKTNADTATSNANTATTQANTARDAANTAATQANTARDAANTAATNAQTKADGLVNKGDYNSATAYVPNNVVQYQGSGYMNILACTNIDPTNTTYWKLIVSKGDKGDKGDQGIQGIQGSTGTSFTWQGSYSGSITYNVRDVVSYQGSSYICTVQTLGNLPTNTQFWNLVALKGNDGAGTVVSVTAGSSDVIVGGTVQNPTIALNVGTGANQIVKRNSSGTIDDVVNLLISPAFTGTPTAPTATGGTNTTQIATTAFVQTATSTLLLKSGGTMTGDLRITKGSAKFITRPDVDTNASIQGNQYENTAGTAIWNVGHQPSSGLWGVFDTVNNRFALVIDANSPTSGLKYLGNIVHHAGNHNSTGDPHTQYMLKTGTGMTGDLTMDSRIIMNSFNDGANSSSRPIYFYATDASAVKTTTNYLQVLAGGANDLYYYQAGSGYKLHHTGNHNSTGDPHTQYLLKTGGTMTGDLRITKSAASFFFRPLVDTDTAILGQRIENSAGTGLWFIGAQPSTGRWGVYDNTNARWSLAVAAGTANDGLTYLGNIVHHAGNHNSTGDPHSQYLLKTGGTMTGSTTLTMDSPRFIMNRASGGSGIFAGIQTQDNTVNKGLLYWDYTLNQWRISENGGTNFSQILHSGNHNSTGDPHTQYLLKTAGLGADNTSVIKQIGAVLETDTRSINITRDATTGKISSVTEKDGGTTIVTSTITRDATTGLISSFTQVAGGSTVTYTVNRDATTSKVTSITKTVS